MSRSFQYDGSRKNKADFTVETDLTDSAAIEALGGFSGNQFRHKCAFEINKASAGYKHSANMVAWGFKLAEEKLNPAPKATFPISLSSEIREMVKFRRPLFDTVEGHQFKIVQHGPRSKYNGGYTITDGGDYPSNEFYGKADSSGKWIIARNTPHAIIERLTGIVIES